MAVAGDVFEGVLFCAILFPQKVLDEIWDWMESVPEIFPTYSYIVHKLVLWVYKLQHNPNTCVFCIQLADYFSSFVYQFWGISWYSKLYYNYLDNYNFTILCLKVILH